MTLKTLQSEFQSLLLKPECLAADWVSESVQGMSSQARLNIYHNAYRLRLVDVLFDTFEHTSIYLGDDWFRQLATHYVETHTSTHTNIGDYGKYFPRFIAQKHASDLEIYELAEMDWVLRRAFDGQDSESMNVAELQSLAENQENNELSLQAVPTACIITQRYNSLDIWQALDRDARPPQAKNLNNPLDVLVWRKGHSPHFRSLSPLEKTAIDCLLRGATINEIGKDLEEHHSGHDMAEAFGVMLRRWMEDELIRKQAHPPPC